MTIDPGALVSSTLTQFREYVNNVGGIGGTVIQNSGTLNVTGAASAAFGIGSSGTYNLIGGTLNTTGAGGPRIGGDGLGVGTFLLNGGTWLNPGGEITMQNGGGGSGSLITVNSGTMSSLLGLNLAANTGNATFNLNGGVAAFGTAFSNTNNTTGAAGPVSVFNWNGGTFQALSSFTITPNLNTNAAITINVMAGGAIVNTNGFNLTFRVPLLSGTTSDGGLTKNGLGTLTLSSTNTFNGPINVNAGTLALDYSLMGTGTNATMANVIPSGAVMNLGSGAGLSITGNPNAVAASSVWTTAAAPRPSHGRQAEMQRG